MDIVKSKNYLFRLLTILDFIYQDKPSASMNFEQELENKIDNLALFPYKYRASYYFDDEAYRDMIFKGYTIIYKVEKSRIVVLDIFKWQEPYY